MDQHVKKYFSSKSDEMPHGNFHRVIALQDEPIIDWQEASNLAPNLCRGWYELAKLPLVDRIEFTREFWISKLPYHPLLTEFLIKFFSSLDDIGVFLTQKKFEDPFAISMVYSLSGDSGFYHGEPPANESDINNLQKKFFNTMLPPDYLAFLQIHDGFAKLNDTGIFRSMMMKPAYDQFQQMLSEEEEITTSLGKPVNPLTLIPFYQSYEQPFFQCFWGEWYPDQEMGNVYYSGAAKTIFACANSSDCIETMAFETFSDWLIFYLEKIE